jgi:hypothetical protein
MGQGSSEAIGCSCHGGRGSASRTGSIASGLATRHALGWLGPLINGKEEEKRRLHRAEEKRRR